MGQDQPRQRDRPEGPDLTQKQGGLVRRIQHQVHLTGLEGLHLTTQAFERLGLVQRDPGEVHKLNTTGEHGLGAIPNPTGADPQNLGVDFQKLRGVRHLAVNPPEPGWFPLQQHLLGQPLAESGGFTSTGDTDEDVTNLRGRQLGSRAGTFLP